MPAFEMDWESCFYSGTQGSLCLRAVPCRFEPELEHELSAYEKELRNGCPGAGGLKDQAGENVAIPPVLSCLCRLLPGALMLSAFLAESVWVMDD